MAKAMRKRVNLEYLVDQANHLLAGAHGTAEHRTGVINMIELALFEADHYQGFRYLNASELPEGVAPGINVDSTGALLDDNERFANCDRTRVQYHYNDNK